MSVKIRGGEAIGTGARETANDRFKKTFDVWLWGGVIAATLFHFALFAFFPELTAADVRFGVKELESIELPPEIEIPPAVRWTESATWCYRYTEIVTAGWSLPSVVTEMCPIASSIV